MLKTSYVLIMTYQRSAKACFKEIRSLFLSIFGTVVYFLPECSPTKFRQTIHSCSIGEILFTPQMDYYIWKCRNFDTIKEQPSNSQTIPMKNSVRGLQHMYKSETYAVPSDSISNVGSVLGSSVTSKTYSAVKAISGFNAAK